MILSVLPLFAIRSAAATVRITNHDGFIAIFYLYSVTLLGYPIGNYSVRYYRNESYPR